MLEKFKKGSGIYIKPENKGKFTKYCNGKVTSECIARGKKSSDPAVRKRATFAANTRYFKHQFGGTIKAQQGTKFNNFGDFLKSDAGQTSISAIGNTALNFLKTNAQNKQAKAQAEAAKAQNEADWEETKQQIIKQNLYDRQNQFNQWMLDYQSGKTLDQPSNIVASHFGNEQLNQQLTEGEQKLKQKNAQIQPEYSDNWGNVAQLLQQGLGIAGDYLSSKKSSNNTVSKTNSFWNKPTVTNNNVDFWNNPSLSGGNQFNGLLSNNTNTQTFFK